MNRKPNTFNQLQASEPQGELVGDGAIVFAMWLLALALSIVFCVVILSSADPEVLWMFGYGFGAN
ncbi:MAG: hypothetical protein PVI80_08325 [Anaerolineae bacterium]|jgi:hypothetical protein